MPTNYTARSTITTVLTTELNSLANGSACTLSAVQDNDTSGTRDLFAQVEVYIAAQGSNRTAGAYLIVYFVPEVDGTNYGSTSGVCLDNYAVGTILLDDATLAARYAIIDRAKLPVGDFKVTLRNYSGQALAASGNTVKMRNYTVEDVT